MREYTEMELKITDHNSGETKVEPLKVTGELVKNSVATRLVSTERNAVYLSDKVHQDLGNGFSIMFDIVVDNYRMAVTKEFADALGCDFVELICAVQTNGIDAPVLNDLASRVMFKDSTNLLEEERHINAGMFVLSNASGVFGAAAIYRAGIGEKVKSIVGDYYLLPSSVHEWIVVPKSANMSVKELSKMVEEANRTVVEEKDILAYGVYEWTPSGLNKVA